MFNEHINEPNLIILVSLQTEKNVDELLQTSINKRVIAVKWNFHCWFRILFKDTKHCTIGNKYPHVLWRSARHTYTDVTAVVTVLQV